SLGACLTSGSYVAAVDAVCVSLIVSPSRLLVSLAVDQPRHPEAVDDHAEPLGPERLLERHDDATALRECVKDALALGRAVHVQREREPFRLLVTLRRD